MTAGKDGEGSHPGCLFRVVAFGPWACGVWVAGLESLGVWAVGLWPLGYLSKFGASFTAVVFQSLRFQGCESRASVLGFSDREGWGGFRVWEEEDRGSVLGL